MFRRVPLGGGGGSGGGGGVIGMSFVQSVLLKDGGLSVSTLNNCQEPRGPPDGQEAPANECQNRSVAFCSPSDLNALRQQHLTQRRGQTNKSGDSSCCLRLALKVSDML